MLATHRFASICFLVFAVFRPVQADEPIELATQKNIEDATAALSGSVANFLDERNVSKKAIVGQVTNEGGSGDAGVREQLINSLRKAKFSISRTKTNIALEGRIYKSFDDAGFSGRQVGLRLQLDVRDRTKRRSLIVFEVPVIGDEAVRKLSPNVDLPPELSERKRQLKTNSAIDRPQFSQSGNVVRPDSVSKFGLEVLRKSGPGFSALRPESIDGVPFVRLNPGDSYAVRLHNNADFEAAVLLTIDGLSMFAFGIDSSKDDLILVPPGKSVIIRGWYVSSSKSDRFKVTTYSESVAALKDVPVASIATISAAFHAAWPPNQAPPQGENASKSGNVGTSRGESIDQKYETVVRVTGRQRALISVRYSR